jgi:hypothetical protein
MTTMGDDNAPFEMLNELQGLLDQPEQEPVAMYQYQMANGSWIDQDKQSYDYNVRHGEANVRIVYTHPAPFTPLTADMVTDEMLLTFLDVIDQPMNYRATLAAAVNVWGAKK